MSLCMYFSVYFVLVHVKVLVNLEIEKISVYAFHIATNIINVISIHIYSCFSYVYRRLEIE